VPAAKRRGPTLLAGHGAVAPRDPEMESPDRREDDRGPSDLGRGKRVEGEVVEVRLQELHDQRRHGDHRRDRARETGPVEVEAAQRRGALEGIALGEMLSEPEMDAPDG